eukprot:1290919-Prymnesium_polylepis.1
MSLVAQSARRVSSLPVVSEVTVAEERVGRRCRSPGRRHRSSRVGDRRDRARVLGGPIRGARNLAGRH